MSYRDSFTDHSLLLIGASSPSTDEKANLVWLSYFVLGAGILAPWNAFITASDYFNMMYSTTHMDRYFTICYLPTCLVTLAVMVKLNSAFSYRSRILCGFIGFFVLLLVVPLVDVVLVAGHSQAPDSATVVVLGAVIFTGLLDGISQGAVFADAATMPQQYTHAVVAGTASAGLLISVLRIITKAALPTDGVDSSSLRASTAIYFSISAFIELACVLIYMVLLPQIPSVQCHRAKVASGALLEMTMRVPELTEEGAWWGPSDVSVTYVSTAFEDKTDSAGLVAESIKPPPQLDFPAQQGTTPIPHLTHSSDATPLFLTQHSSYQSFNEQEAMMDVSKERVLDVMQHSWKLSVSLVLVYAVTLSIFPGVLAEDVHSAELGDWYNIALMFTFNVADVLGRLIPFPTATWAAPTPTRILHHSLARILFIPAFLLAMKLQAHPAIVSLLALLLGVSNGFLTAAAMTIAPAGLSAKDAGLVENILVLALVLGLTIGAFSGWLWVV